MARLTPTMRGPGEHDDCLCGMLPGVAHILLKGTDLLLVCSRSEPQAPWLAKGYQRVLGGGAVMAVERAVREGFSLTLTQLWHEAFRKAPPPAHSLRKLRSELMGAIHGPLPKLIVLRYAPALPRATFELPVLQDPGLVTDAPPGHIMWIGFELLDQDGTPIAGEPFLLRTPDGQQSTQRLNERGMARKDPTLDGLFGFKLAGREPATLTLENFLDLEIVDTAGAPIAGTQYQVIVGGALIRAGAVDRDGRAHIDDLPPGPYEILLPGFEPSAVTLDGTAAHAASSAARPASTYNVKQGDTLAKIAKSHGIKSGKALYDAPENSALRKKRPNPDRIRAGDEVNIPSGKAAAVALKPGIINTLLIDAPATGTKLQLRFIGPDEQPINATYALSGSGFAFEGKLASDGSLEQLLPDGCAEVALSIHGEEFSIEQRLSLRDDDDSPEATQIRLANLGWYGGPIDGDEKSTTFASAAALYRKERKLGEGDGIDKRLQQRVDEEYLA